jgi:integrase
LKTLDYDTKSIKLRSAKKTIVSLTIDELSKLENLDVSQSSEQQKVKDMFLLGCYTGLRVSDLKRLNPINTQGGVINMKLTKNDRQVAIPIISDCARILSRYNYSAPKINEQAVNEGIKVIAEKAGITDKIHIDLTKGGKKISKAIPKYEAITTHIAGKTFITLAPKKWGLTPAEIAAVVGKDLKTLLNSYFNLPSEDAKVKMIQSDNQSKMKIIS